MIRRFLLLALLLAVALPGYALPAKTWVVAIGNNRGGPGDVPLMYATRDAEALAEVLRQQGPVASRRISLVLDEKATEARRTLQEINAEIRAQANDEPTALIVFYSGHADAGALRMKGTEFEMDELKTLVEGSPASVRLLVVDACRSGQVTRVKGVTPAESFAIDIQSQSVIEGLAIITSSAAGEVAQESDRLRGSFFTHHLVNALRGAADRDRDGRVTLGEAYAYTYTQTLRSSGQTLALQHPTYAWEMKGRGDLVLARVSQADGPLAKLRLGSSALYLVTDENQGGAVVAEVFTPADDMVLLVAPGSYLVQQRNPEEYREYRVRLASGDERELSKLEYRTVRYDHLVRLRGGERTSVQGLTLMLGGRTGMLAREGFTPQLVVGYGMDFAWGTVGLRLRGSTVTSPGFVGAPRRHDEWGAGVSYHRYFDLPWIAFGMGVYVEGAWHRQLLQGGDAPMPRSAAVGSLGGLISLERSLAGGLAARLELGRASAIYREAPLDGGSGSRLTSTLMWWGAGGAVWRF